MTTVYNLASHPSTTIGIIALVLLCCLAYGVLRAVMNICREIDE